MGHRRVLFHFHPYFLLVLSLQFCLMKAQIELYSECVPNVGNYIQGSAYQKNKETLLSTLSTNIGIGIGTGAYGFHSSSFGQEPDRAYAVTLCRADVDHDSCQRCVTDSVPLLTSLCRGNKEAMGWWHDAKCMLRYSSRPLTGWLSTDDNYKCVWDYYNSTSPELYSAAVQSLLADLRPKAAAGGPLLKFAVGDATVTVTGPESQSTIYAVVQCTPDLSEELCNTCLIRAISQFSNCRNLSLSKGGRIMYPNCNFQFESYMFYNQTGVTEAFNRDPNPPILPKGLIKSNRRKRIMIIAVSVSIASTLVIILSVASIWLARRRRRLRTSLPKTDQYGTDIDVNFEEESLQCDFDTIKAATNDFAEGNKLGKGGFGAVYKGKLTNGVEIAVKRLSRDKGQGDIEFKNEVMLVAKLQHRNLVRMLGFSMEAAERLLVYELLDNSSLDHFLFDPKKQGLLNWGRRFKIIGGVARGLLYLHEDSRLRIIHRDLKASNVLLDSNMNAKIADFGMARLSIMDETQGNTKRIVGTYGYMAPEYAMHGNFSVKSDVFSFGVLVLEIVSGQRNNSFRSNGENVEDLLSFAWKSWREGTSSNLIDPTLRDGGESIRDIMRCIHIGLLCCQSTVADRPTMATVVLMLNSFSLTLALPSEPAFFNEKRAECSSTISQDLDNFSNNEVSVSQMIPR